MRSIPGFTAARFRPWLDVPRLLRDGPNLLTERTRESGDRLHLRMGTADFLLVSHPDDARHVLVSNASNYTKSDHYRGLKVTLGQGLVTSEGKLWRRQRSLLQPAFRPSAIDAMTPVMTACTRSMLARWERAGVDAFDVHEAMMRLTFHIAGLTLFGEELLGESEEFASALEVALVFANEYSESLFPLPLWTPLPKYVGFYRAKKRLDATIARVVAERRAALSTRPHSADADLLTAMIRATDDQGRMSDRLLRDEAITLLIAGHETTAAALSWTFWLLAQHPQVAAAVADEASHVSESPSIEEIRRLDLIPRVLRESMRLRPPVWMVERQAIRDDRLSGGAQIPAGTMVGVSPWVIHRAERWWENPEGFDPDRFLPANAASRHRYAYLPFGAGPRVCIGGGFAMLEATIVLAMVARRWRLELEAGFETRYYPGITLRPVGGIRMRRRPVQPSTKKSAVS